MSYAGTLNNAAFSIPCMRLFAASRPNSAPPQTMGLVPAACLHVITKASQTFPVPAHEYLTSCISWLTPASTTLSQIKYGEQRNKKTSGERVSSGCQLNLVRLKKFVQVSERTGFCVDTENAAV